MGPKVPDNRIAWIIALAAVLGAGAIAFGFSTPGDRIAKMENRIEDHESRIQKLEDIHDYIVSIADAVDAKKPQKRKR